MATNNTDLTEEDATDLQFPKAAPADCASCRRALPAPHILCEPCQLPLCPPCFARGAEPGAHRNDHPYRVLRDDFALLAGSDWTAGEEAALVEALDRLASFELVARRMPGRSADEVRRHYDWFYVDRPQAGLPTHSRPLPDAYIDPVVPYRARLNRSEDPPRYEPHSVGFVALAGYNPARSDFENEFDANAEDLLGALVAGEAEPGGLTEKLHVGLVRAYNRRLAERERWKGVVRAHGLILLRRTNAWLNRYQFTVTKAVCEKLVHFMQYCAPMQFDMLMEGLHHSGELKINILRLCELRQKGIKKLADARLYMRIKNLHEKCEFRLKKFHSNVDFNWKSKNKTMTSLTEMPLERQRRYRPLDIVGLPSYEKLTPSERHLCETVRLVPISYLELKELLINENKKLGSMKLKTARRMLKIDVNKTRKLFDFLVTEGYVNLAT